EEAFFTFCYSPIFVGDEVAGVLDISIETTAAVVTDRRLSLIGELAAAMVAARDVGEVCADAVLALGGAADVRGAEIRLWVGDQLLPLAASDPVVAGSVPAEEIED